MSTDSIPRDDMFDGSPDMPKSTLDVGGTLENEAEYRALIVAELKNRVHVRIAAVSTAIVTLFALGAYAFTVLNMIKIDAAVMIPWMGLNRTAAVAMVITPLVAMSTIVAMLLFGAFRRFKDDDIDKVDIKSLLMEAVKGRSQE